MGIETLVGITASQAAVGAAVSTALVSAYGAISSGQAQSQAAAYQSQVNANNAVIAQQNAQYARQAGDAQAAQKQMETAQQTGAIRAAAAANGLDVNNGTALNVQTSQKLLGNNDVLNIRNNALRQVYGYQAQATGFEAQGQLDQMQSSSATSGSILSATGSLLSGASSAAMMQAKSGGSTAPSIFATGVAPKVEF